MRDCGGGSTASDGGPSGGCRRYARDDTIYLQGDPAGCWFEVAGGVVRTCRYHADGHRQLTGFFYPGDVFGIDRGVRRASAEAVTEGAAVVPHASSQARPEALAVIERALQSAEDFIVLLGHRGAAERLAAFLLTMDRRLGTREGLVVPMSRYDIADHLGLTIATVSRSIGEFARRRLIELRTPQRLRVLDRPALERMAGGGADPDPFEGEECAERVFMFDAPARTTRRTMPA